MECQKQESKTCNLEIGSCEGELEYSLFDESISDSQESVSDVTGSVILASSVAAAPDPMGA